MKRNNCSIVQDLLPMYIEAILRPDTVEYVEDHLSGCQTCTAALGDLKAETAAPIPAPDTAETRQADQQVLKGLRKNLTIQNIMICSVAFLYFALLYTPLRGFASVFPIRVEALILLLTAGPLCVILYSAFHRSDISRNVTLTLTGLALIVGGFPLYEVGSFFYKAIYNTLFVPNSYRPDSPLEWLGLWMPTWGMNISVISASIIAIILAVIVLRRLWRKTLPLKVSFPRPLRHLHRTAMITSILIIVLHLIPWQFIYHYSPNDHFPLDFTNLLTTFIPLYCTAAAAFAEISSREHAWFASALALIMPVYVSLAFLSHFDAEYAIFGWQRPEFFHPVYTSLFLILSCLLAATAICSVWYKLKQQTREDHK